MSDTEDTDSLLSVATPAGLSNFLGLTVEEMSTHINSMANSNIDSAQERKKTYETSDLVPTKSRENILNQLEEWSDSENDAEDDDKYVSEGEASTASTNSITLLMTSDNQEDQNHENEVEVDADKDLTSALIDAEKMAAYTNAVDDMSKSVLEFKYDKHKSPNYGVRVSPGFGTQGLDFLRPSPNSGWRILPGSETESQFIQRAPNFRTPGGYKPPENPLPPRDLTDAQILEEVRNMYAFPEGDQVARVKKNECATEEEKPGLKGEGDGNLKGEGDGNVKSEEIDSQIISTPNTQEGDSAEAPDAEDDKAKSEMSVAGETFVKRTSYTLGDNESSIPDLGFGIRDLNKLEVKETPIVPVHAWPNGASGSNSGPVEKKPTRKDKLTVSFEQLRDDANVEISPVKAAYLQTTGMGTDISRCLPRYRPSNRNVNKSPKKVNLLQLDLLWRDIRQTKERMEEDIKKSSAQLQAVSVEPLSGENAAKSEKSNQYEASSLNSDITDTPPQQDSPLISTTPKAVEQPENSEPDTKKVSKSILKTKESRPKNSDGSKATDVSFDLSGATEDVANTMSGLDSTLLPTDLDTIDLSTILSAAHLKTSEFEEILEKLDECEEDTFEDIQTADEEIENILTNFQVSDWAKSGASEYLQKFHEEKFKREHCEKEIAALQKAVLKLEEESTVRDKMISKKDAVLIKMSKAWNEVTKQWKAHERQSKEILDKLQLNQKILTESLRISKERIEAYEKELANAVHLAAKFKAKLESLESSHVDEIDKLQTTNTNLKEKFSDLEKSLESLRVEKDVAVRALGESQKQLDERINVHGKIQEQLVYLEEESQERQKELQKIATEKSDLENNLQSIAYEKDTLEAHLVSLTDQLRLECDEKERLKQNQHLELETSLKKESDRLHTYYNMKLQEALQLQTQRVATTETQMIKNHQKELSRMDKEMTRKIRDCKNKCLSEVNKLTNQYEDEIKVLREDMAQKQLFISTISRQLQSYVQSDSSRSQSGKGKSSHDNVNLSKSNLAAANNDNLELSLASSTDSTPNCSPKFPVRAMKSRSQYEFHTDEGNSSGEDFQPAKLSRYNTSTPNSVLESNPSLRNIKAWRELPNIKHLLNSEGENSRDTHIYSEASKLFNMFPATRSLLHDRSSCLENTSKFERTDVESDLEKRIHTLVKIYSDQRSETSSKQVDVHTNNSNNDTQTAGQMNCPENSVGKNPSILSNCKSSNTDTPSGKPSPCLSKHLDRDPKVGDSINSNSKSGKVTKPPWK